MTLLDSSEATLLTPQTPRLTRIDANRTERRAWVKAGILDDASDKVYCLAGYTYSQVIAVEQNREKYTKSFEELVPAEYHCHRKVFFKQDSTQLSEHRP